MHPARLRLLHSFGDTIVRKSGTGDRLSRQAVGRKARFGVRLLPVRLHGSRVESAVLPDAAHPLESRSEPMADIHVERKSPAIWPWVVGLVALGLLIWALSALFGGGGEEEAGELGFVAPMEGEAPPVAPPLDGMQGVVAGAGFPVSEILRSPAEWSGRTVAGEVRVAEVPTDRGFWIEDRGERIFVILGDAPAEQPVDVQAGQRLRMSAATVHTDLAGVPGDVDADTRRIVQGIPAFLTVDEANLEILEPSGA
jgi:hypothetical protein